MAFHLYIMRHAKSDWSRSGGSDFDRPINKRGQKNAKRIGQWMQEHGHIPEKIICSPAVRAKETIERVLGQIKKEEVIFDKDLYLADLDTLLECIHLYKSDVQSLMLVAHNPGLDYLVNYLSSRSIQADSQGKTVTTANLVIFKYTDNTFSPESDKGELLEFIKPKELD